MSDIDPRDTFDEQAAMGSESTPTYVVFTRCDHAGRHTALGTILDLTFTEVGRSNRLMLKLDEAEALLLRDAITAALDERFNDEP